MMQGSQARDAWERHLWAAAAPWPAAGGISGCEMIDEFVCIWRGIGELVVFVGGSDEYDELILDSEIMGFVEGLLKEHCGGKINEAALLHSDTYAKLVVSFEEMLRSGHLLHTSLDAVLEMSKGRRSAKS